MKSSIKFLAKIMQLGAELDNTSDKFQMMMIVNDAQLAYDQHIEELFQQNGMIRYTGKEE